MEAQELSIGSLVRVNKDVCIKKGTIVEIRQIDADNTFEELRGCAFCRPLDKKQFGGGVWLDYLDPIPITPEILEKNGFYYGHTAGEEDNCVLACEYPKKGWCYGEGAGEIKIIFPNETDGGLIRIDDECFDRAIAFVFGKQVFVHELQHALRLCGIDKEIEL